MGDEVLFSVAHDGHVTGSDRPLWGFNSRLDDLRAALVDLPFREYSGIVARRIAFH